MSYLNKIAVCLLIIIVRSECCGEDKPMDERIRAIWNASSRQVASESWKRTKEDRETIIREFKARLDNGNSPSEVRHILMLLGDREATKTEVQNSLVLDQGGALWASGSPIAIEYLGPHVFGNEPFKITMVGGDVGHIPLSFGVTNIIVQILAESPAFTAEVNGWAGRAQVSAPEGKRAVLQHWWNENKVHFEKEDYKAVKPGRPFPSISDEENERRRKEGLPPLEEPGPKQPTPGPPPAAPKPPSPPQPASEPAHSSKTLYYIAAVLAALLAALLGIFTRRKR